MRSCYHLGGGAGYRSEVRIYPHLGYGICVMGNETSYDAGAVTRMLVSAPASAGDGTDIVRRDSERSLQVSFYLRDEPRLEHSEQRRAPRSAYYSFRLQDE